MYEKWADSFMAWQFATSGKAMWPTQWDSVWRCRLVALFSLVSMLIYYCFVFLFVENDWIYISVALIRRYGSGYFQSHKMLQIQSLLFHFSNVNLLRWGWPRSFEYDRVTECTRTVSMQFSVHVMTLIIPYDEYRLWNSSLCFFLHIPVTFITASVETSVAKSEGKKEDAHL